MTVQSSNMNPAQLPSKNVSVVGGPGTGAPFNPDEKRTLDFRGTLVQWVLFYIFIVEMILYGGGFNIDTSISAYLTADSPVYSMI